MKLRISEKTSGKLVPFAELVAGELFFHNETIFMKITPDMSGNRNAVDLSDGDSFYYFTYQDIIKVKAELIWEHE